MSRGRRWIGSLGGAVPYVRWMVFRHQLCVIDRQGVKVRLCLTRCKYVATKAHEKSPPPCGFQLPRQEKTSKEEWWATPFWMFQGARPLKASGLYKNKKQKTLPKKAPLFFVGRGFRTPPGAKTADPVQGLLTQGPFSVQGNPPLPNPQKT